MNYNPRLSVLRHHKTGDLLIMNYGVEPEFGFLSDSGQLIRLDNDALEQLSKTLLYFLSTFTSRTYERGEVSNLSISEKRRFNRIYDEVAITMVSKRELELQPMIPVRGKMGAQGDKKQAMMVSLPIDSKKLHRLLLVAFDRCRETAR